MLFFSYKLLFSEKQGWMKNKKKEVVCLLEKKHNEFSF